MIIDKLFEIYNIKYVISVDDCYLSPKREDIEAKIYSEMYESINPFRDCLLSLGKEEKIKEYDELMTLGFDIKLILTQLIKDFSQEELLKLLCIIEQTETDIIEERKCIIDFLENLLEHGYIEKYWTFPSTADASKFDIDAEIENTGSVLWLLDRNFERVGESPDAGITLAKTIVKRRGGRDNFVYVLSAIGQDSDTNEDQIESEFDKVLSTECDLQTASFVYYINKERILSKQEKKIVRSLVQGFKRKICYELFEIYTNCLSESVQNSKNIILRINQKTLNYLLYKIVNDKGESHISFLTRLVQIFQSDEYHRMLAEKYDLIVDKLACYGEICELVNDLVGDSNEVTPILKKFRDVELYNKHINREYMEVSTGDIFEIEGEFFLLVSQVCDTNLRKDGKRKLEWASLLKIDTEKTHTEYKYKLSCFQKFENVAVLYQETKMVPFDILDLCVLDNEGEASVDIECFNVRNALDLKRYTPNFAKRYNIIINNLKAIYDSQITMEKYWDSKGEISSERAKGAYEIAINTDPFLKKFQISNKKIIYPVKRVCRLNELITVDIVKEYGLVLSRIGHPFDFSK